MPKRAFLFPFIILIALVFLSSPPLLKPFFPEVTQTPTATVVTPSATPSATSTPDPFAPQKQILRLPKRLHPSCFLR